MALDKVTKESRTETEWRDLLKIMAVQGMKLSTEESDTVLEYLTKNLGKASCSATARKEITYSRNVGPILARTNDQASDWRQLFNGKDLTGWKFVGKGHNEALPIADPLEPHHVWGVGVS